jgi:hypothetical protein
VYRVKKAPENRLLALIRIQIFYTLQPVTNPFLHASQRFSKGLRVCPTSLRHIRATTAFSANLRSQFAYQFTGFYTVSDIFGHSSNQ